METLACAAPAANSIRVVAATRRERIYLWPPGLSFRTAPHPTNQYARLSGMVPVTLSGPPKGERSQLAALTATTRRDSGGVPCPSSFTILSPQHGGGSRHGNPSVIPAL